MLVINLSIEKGIYAIDFFVYRNAGPQPTPYYNEQMVGETRAAQSGVRARFRPAARGRSGRRLRRDPPRHPVSSRRP